MPIGNRLVGEHLRVWSVDAGKQVEDRCFLIAHGDQRWLPSCITKFDPQTTVHFFTSHGNALITSLENLLEGNKAPVETVHKGGLCHDYTLTKAQGYHAHPYTWFGLINKAIDKVTSKQRGVSYEAIEEAAKDYQYDLITIRFRPLKPSTTLRDSMRQLQAAGYKYEAIYCVICR
jgi:hypothetical protein